MRLSLLAALALPALLGGQPPTLRVPAEPACATCRIDVTLAFTIANLPGGAVTPESHLALDSIHRFLVVTAPGPRVAILDSTGRFAGYLAWSSTRTDVPMRQVSV